MRTKKDEFTEGIIDSLARLILSDMHKKDAEDESAPSERREHEDTFNQSQKEF